MLTKSITLPNANQLTDKAIGFGVKAKKFMDTMNFSGLLNGKSFADGLYMAIRIDGQILTMPVQFDSFVAGEDGNILRMNVIPSKGPHKGKIIPLPSSAIVNKNSKGTYTQAWKTQLRKELAYQKFAQQFADFFGDDIEETEE